MASSSLRRTTESFVKEAKEKRPDVTVLSEYVGVTKLVQLRCECGWEYEQTPQNLFRGRKSCPICGNVGNGKMSTEIFIAKSKKVHGDYYDYSKAEYNGPREPTTIICPVHGEFAQTPTAHMNEKSGCNQCGIERAKHYVGWTYSNWEEAAKTSSSFEAFKLYKVKCYDLETGEEFMKIGKTFATLEHRFRQLPYKYEVLEVVEGTSRFISELEILLHNQYKALKYTPEKRFAGCTECFTIND